MPSNGCDPLGIDPGSVREAEILDAMDGLPVTVRLLETFGIRSELPAAFARPGATIVVHFCRDEASAEDLAAELGSDIVVQADLADAAARKQRNRG